MKRRRVRAGEPSIGPEALEAAQRRVRDLDGAVDAESLRSGRYLRDMAESHVKYSRDLLPLKPIAPGGVWTWGSMSSGC